MDHGPAENDPAFAHDALTRAEPRRRRAEQPPRISDEAINAERGGLRATDAADRRHHGVTRDEVRRETAARQRESLHVVLSANPLRRSAEGTLTSQPDYEQRREEFMRDLALRAHQSGRAPDVAFGGVGSGLDPAAARERNPMMYPPPSATRRRFYTGEAAHSGRGGLGADHLREQARRQAASTSRAHQPGVMGRIRAWLGGQNRVARFTTVLFIVLLLNTRRIFSLVGGSTWNEAIFGIQATPNQPRTNKGISSAARTEPARQADATDSPQPAESEL